jgi:hypothetical protein
MMTKLDDTYEAQGLLQSIELKNYSDKKKQEATVIVNEFFANINKRNQESINELLPANIEDIPEQMSHLEHIQYRLTL